ncbi:MAG: trigger factor [Clostridiales bacterium]|nr:trigger factor [Clostridiales bacterium]
MKKDLKKLENKNMQLTLELNKDEWEAWVDEAYNKNKGKYKVEGFRAGKAPRKMIEKAYGFEVFFSDAIADGFNKVYIEILDTDKSFTPIDGPEIRVDKFDENGITIVAEIPVMPEVKLGKYTGLKVNVNPEEVTDKDVEIELKRVQNQNTRLVEKDGAIENGDVANIDFKGSIDGEYFEGGTAEGYDLEIGSHSFIDTFEDQLVGLKTGDTKDVMVKFPEKYGAENLAGKPAKFEVKVNAVKVKELPEINDEFASNVSEFETLDEYKKHIKEHLGEHAKEDAKIKTQNEIINKIVEGVECDVPELLAKRELDALMQDMEYRLMYQGASLEAYAEYIGKTVDEIREERKEDAVKSVKIRLALQEILNAEKIDVTDKDIDKYVENIAKKVNKSLEEYKSTLTDERLNYIKNELLMTKLLDFLVENNK